jgi:hypothetical protein
VFSLDGTVSSIGLLAVLDIGLIVSVDALHHPIVVISLSDSFEVSANNVGANNGDSKHVAVVL